MKIYHLLPIVFSILVFFVSGQSKEENLSMQWPIEYNWKVVSQVNDSTKTSTMIIPGKDKIETASIIGSVAAYIGIKYPNMDEIIKHYKEALDSGSVLTEVERNSKAKYSWVMFKVETPVTTKYSEPESDLYYIVQGRYALYENYVAIKKPNLSADFIAEWMKVFKTAKITLE